MAASILNLYEYSGILYRDLMYRKSGITDVTSTSRVGGCVWIAAASNIAKSGV